MSPLRTILALVLALALGACGAAAPVPDVHMRPLTGLAAPAANSFRRSLEAELARVAGHGPVTPGCVVEAGAATDDRGRIGLAPRADAARIEVRVDLLLRCPDAEPVTSTASGSALAPLGMGDAVAGRHRAVELALDEAARRAVRGLLGAAGR